METSPVNYLHVFAYSDRPGTAASDMAPKVSPEKVAARSAALRALGRRNGASFCRASRAKWRRWSWDVEIVPGSWKP